MQAKVEAAKSRAMHSTVHENMLKLLNEERVAVEVGYDTHSEHQEQTNAEPLLPKSKDILDSSRSKEQEPELKQHRHAEKVSYVHSHH